MITLPVWKRNDITVAVLDELIIPARGIAVCSANGRVNLHSALRNFPHSAFPKQPKAMIYGHRNQERRLLGANCQDAAEAVTGITVTRDESRRVSCRRGSNLACVIRIIWFYPVFGQTDLSALMDCLTLPCCGPIRIVLEQQAFKTWARLEVWI